MSSNRDNLLDKYSAKVYKNRKEHILQFEQGGEKQVISANTRAIPGVITERGCCYSGCKGVVLGPVKDVCTITHGPIGCGFYTWGTRRNKAKPDPDGKNFTVYCLSTDMQEPDIVFGGEKKLAKAIEEAVELFSPKFIAIACTCPIGLIGDDVQAVAKTAEEKFGIKVVAFNCEGYKGVSQSGGHHIANNGLMRHIIGTGDKQPETKFSINVLGEYNIGGDGWEVERILKRCGFEVRNIFTGDGTFESLKSAHTAHLNIVMCHRSINYVAEMMRQKYGMNWMKVNFIGMNASCQSLRKIAKYFDNPELTKRVEEVIADEMAAIKEDMEYYRSKLEGKTAGVFAGGARAHHYKILLKDLGMKAIITGYEFAHRDDYEGREVIPTIKEDADSKNIENMVLEPDKELYRKQLTPEQIEEFKEKGIVLGDYPGLFPDTEAEDIVVDDYNHFETEQLLKIFKPDILLSGVKDKYSIQKTGVASRQIHAYDYSGPYAGFRGAVNFGRDLTMDLYTNAWKLVTPPWKHGPMINGQFKEDK